MWSDDVERDAPSLRAAFVSGHAPVHDVARLPAEYHGARDGHEGSHHFLADDVVSAVREGTRPTVNAWLAARFTLPVVVAHRSATQGGARLPVHDLGDPPATASA